MATPKPLREVLERALEMARDHRREAPKVPPGWPEKAQMALASGDESVMWSIAAVICRAHVSYDASPEIKSWLFDLRKTVWPQRRPEAENNEGN
jgi:hypothetical protein